MLKARIPHAVIAEARSFACKVWDCRGKNPDKFLMSDDQHAELMADIKGFEVEFAHCHAFGLNYPVIYGGREVDKFDCILAAPNEQGFLQVKRFDVKRSPELYINKKQFERKEVDAFLFEDLEFLDFDNDVIFLQIHGWIEKKDVPANSALVKFENGSEAYQVSKNALKKPDVLFSLKGIRGTENEKKEGLNC